MVKGEEVTMAAHGKPVHVNALCHRRALGGGGFTTAGDAIGWALKKIRAQGGVALVNHPNFDWALTLADLENARGAALLEIWSGHPYVHTEGDATRPSHEVLWQQMLDRGIDIAGVAVDDMHNLIPSAPEPASRPGRGWVDVFAQTPTEKDICAALGAGKLVASNGPHLGRFTVKGDTMSLVAPPGDRVEFLGQEGALLEAVTPTREQPSASYTLKGGERYVRARITAADGTRAWTQAYRVR